MGYAAVGDDLMLPLATVLLLFAVQCSTGLTDTLIVHARLNTTSCEDARMWIQSHPYVKDVHNSVWQITSAVCVRERQV